MHNINTIVNEVTKLYTT